MTKDIFTKFAADFDALCSKHNMGLSLNWPDYEVAEIMVTDDEEEEYVTGRDLLRHRQNAIEAEIRQRARSQAFEKLCNKQDKCVHVFSMEYLSNSSIGATQRQKCDKCGYCENWQ